jgi:hypothetical protein
MPKLTLQLVVLLISDTLSSLEKIEQCISEALLGRIDHLKNDRVSEKPGEVVAKETRR